MARQSRFNAELLVSGLLLAGLAVAAARYETPRSRGRGRAGAAPVADAPFGELPASAEPAAIQHRRAREPGRGRGAASPAGIPARGWRDIVLRVYQQSGEDRLLAVAAGVVFYGILAIFPALTALVSFYGLFAKAASIGDHLSLLATLMPGSAYDIISGEITRLVAKSDGKLSLGFAAGVAVALWSANAGMKAMIDALNVIYEEDEKRGFVRLNAVSLAMTFGALAAFLLAIGTIVIFPLVLERLWLSAFAEHLVALLRWPALLLLVVAGLAVLYRFGPSRRQAQWLWLAPGTMLAAAAGIGGSLLFSWYLANFADYNATYGSLGAAIGLMMWLWLTVIAILIGAQFNAEMEHQTARDTTTGRPKALGRRGATMADTVGAAQP